MDTNVILDEVHEEQPEKEAIPLIPALEEENVVVEEEKSVFEQALEATVQQIQKKMIRIINIIMFLMTCK